MPFSCCCGSYQKEEHPWMAVEWKAQACFQQDVCWNGYKQKEEKNPQELCYRWEEGHPYRERCQNKSQKNHPFFWLTWAQQTETPSPSSQALEGSSPSHFSPNPQGTHQHINTTPSLLPATQIQQIDSTSQHMPPHTWWKATIVSSQK